MKEKRTEWLGVVVGGPLDGQAANHLAPTFRVAEHKISKGLPLVFPVSPLTNTKVVDRVYQHHGILVQEPDGKWTEYGIWALQGENPIKALVSVFDFYMERKNAGKT